MRRILLLLSAAALVGCLDTTGPTPSDPTHEVFASSLNIDISTMSKTSVGVFYADSAIGTGAVAKATDTVIVAYQGFIPNGTRFTQSQDTIPLQQTIVGFADGVSGMAVGGHRLLVIPSALAWGNSSVQAGSVIIPANSTIIFDVQLKGIYTAASSTPNRLPMTAPAWLERQ